MFLKAHSLWRTFLATSDEATRCYRVERTRKLVVTKLYTVASGWAGSCVITTEMPCELATKAR